MGLSLVVFALVVKLHEGAADAKSSMHGAAATADPLTARQMRSFLSTRTGSVSVAVRDLRTGQEWLYEPKHGDGRAYLIAALTAHDPSQGYGIDTIQGISRLVWAGLGSLGR